MPCMKTQTLDFSYPESLVAKEPVRPSRVLFVENQKDPREVSVDELLRMIPPGDVVVINDTKVVKKRLFSLNGDEVLFLDEEAPAEWSVLFPAKRFKIGDTIEFAGELTATLIEKGLPQKLGVNRALDFSYFAEHGFLALPPYIQAARGERQSRLQDETWYQTQWAENLGSAAAPTASLHFTNENWQAIEKKGVQVVHLTLHVGLGTFLPVHAEDLNDHKMHSEWVQIPNTTTQAIRDCRKRGGRVWALGTTVTRALESWPLGFFKETEVGLEGSTDIFIKPGFKFQVVDVLMTNFHQPKSTLLALVAAFAGFDRVMQVYATAVKQKFRLFSYGDLSVWKNK
jgi:S-adenosylmethionine:tRNA ribosyltransferase-isomerase